VSREDMRWIPGGTFAMGSEDFYPEEGPVHPVSVDGFWIDRHPVTAAEFRRFVRETKYVTFAERPLDPTDFPDADPDLLVPGSLVFRKTAGPVDLDDLLRPALAHDANLLSLRRDGWRTSATPGARGRSSRRR